MGFVKMVAPAACMLGISLAMGGCLLTSVREKEAMAPPTLTAAKVHASIAAPVLPIFVLRVARDELGLDVAERASIAMIASEAESKSHVIVHARAAYLEILAQCVDDGSVDESQVALYAEQVAWAVGESRVALRAAMVNLSDALTPEQRTLLVAKVAEQMPLWAPTWAATNQEHRWLSSFAQRDLPDFAADLDRTSRHWVEASAASVRRALPALDPARRRALAGSLRTGQIE